MSNQYPVPPVDSLVVSTDAYRNLFYTLWRKAARQETNRVAEDYGNVDSLSLSETTAKRMSSIGKFVDSVINNKQLLLDLHNGNQAEVEEFGEKFTLRVTDIESSTYVKVSDIDALVDGYATRLSPEDAGNLGWYNSQVVFQVTKPEFLPEYLGDAKLPLLSRLVWQLKYNNFKRAWASLASISIGGNHRAPNNALYFRLNSSAYGINDERHVPLAEWQAVHRAMQRVHDFKVDRSELQSVRDEVLNTQATVAASETAQRRRLSEQSFTTMMSNIKSQKKILAYQARRVTDPTVVAEAAEQWESINIPESGTSTAGRTWGIEIETVRADLVGEAPAHWREEGDGSLSGEYNCECGCDDCSDGDHCYYDDCESDDANCAEYVSPVLKWFNSGGLRDICDALPDVERNSTPGVHVHVGASDLSVVDVGRLLFAYSVVSPLIEPLYHRVVRGYCKDTPADAVKYWLGEARRLYRETGAVPNPQDIVYQQPQDRYHDVNTQALAKHGTIEFRAMGPFYNYEHLVRWAWFCREMVNVSRLDLRQSVWTNCNSVTDVINVLRTYGKEQALVATATGESEE